MTSGPRCSAPGPGWAASPPWSCRRGRRWRWWCSSWSRRSSAGRGQPWARRSPGRRWPASGSSMPGASPRARCTTWPSRARWSPRRWSSPAIPASATGVSATSWWCGATCGGWRDGGRRTTCAAPSWCWPTRAGSTPLSESGCGSRGAWDRRTTERPRCSACAVSRRWSTGPAPGGGERPPCGTRSARPSHRAPRTPASWCRRWWWATTAASTRDSPTTSAPRG